MLLCAVLAMCAVRSTPHADAVLAVRYGSAFAHGMQLAVRPKIIFDMCVCDATFMFEATLLHTLELAPDIDILVFQLHDYSFVGGSTQYTYM